MDLKVMPRSHKGQKYILCIIDEVTNYLITVPIFQARSEGVGESLIENVITKYCIPEYIIMDQDNAFMSSLMTYLLNKFDIKSKQLHPTTTNPFRPNMELSHFLAFLPSILQIWVRCGQSICH